MPIVIALRNQKTPEHNFNDIFLLVKEQDFPIEAVELIKYRIEEGLKSNEISTIEDILAIAEITIEENNGTLIPFILYNVLY
jgi:hypothetical protein